MKTRTMRLLQFASAALAAGTLFQTSGCLTDQATGGLLTAFLGAIIQSLVAGSFNLV